jgi:hypothetical protein
MPSLTAPVIPAASTRTRIKETVTDWRLRWKTE